MFYYPLWKVYLNQKLNILINYDVFLTTFHTVSKHSYSWQWGYIFFRVIDLKPSSINFKNIDSLENFKILIKKWKPVKLPLKAMQGLHKNVGFLCNKKPCIISQDNILITKFHFQLRLFSFLFHQKFDLSTVFWWQEYHGLNNTPTVLFGLYDLLLPQDSTG